MTKKKKVENINLIFPEERLTINEDSTVYKVVGRLVSSDHSDVLGLVKDVLEEDYVALVLIRKNMIEGILCEKENNESEL